MEAADVAVFSNLCALFVAAFAASPAAARSASERRSVTTVLSESAPSLYSVYRNAPSEKKCTSRTCLLTAESPSPAR